MLTLPPQTESDWTVEENAIKDMYNCEFKCEKRQLVVVAKHNIEPSSEPLELLVNYRGLHSYWLPLLVTRKKDNKCASGTERHCKLAPGFGTM